MIRVLTPSQFDAFIESADRYIGVRFPVSYLDRNRVIGLYRNGELYGGFVIAKEGLRALESVPHGEIPLDVISLIHKQRIFEINALWLRPDVGGFWRSRLWLELYLEIIRTRRPYFVYAYSLSKPYIGDLYQIAKPRTVFRGQTRILAGMKNFEQEVVELGSALALHASWFRQPCFLLSKAIKKGRRSYAEACSEVNHVQA